MAPTNTEDGPGGAGKQQKPWNVLLPAGAPMLQKDSQAVKLLLAAGAELGEPNDPYLLDLLPPVAGSLFATKVGSAATAGLGAGALGDTSP